VWFNLAAAHFSPADTSDRNAAAKERDRVAAKMTPPQIAEAQRVAREWSRNQTDLMTAWQQGDAGDELATADPNRPLQMTPDAGRSGRDSRHTRPGRDVLGCNPVSRPPLGATMRRREFITLVGGAAAWPVAARAQQSAMPVVAVVNGGSPAGEDRATFERGLSETGYVEGQNVTVERHWLDGQYEGVASLMADLVRRRVAVIATPGSTLATLAAKAATTTIPIVFGVAGDPVELGLVESLPRPGGNATGISFLSVDVRPKRLELLHELVPKAVRIAVLAYSTRADGADFVPRDMRDAARSLGLQIMTLNASTSHEIEAAFERLVRDQADALFVAPDAFFTSRRAQFATLEAHYGIPATYSTRSFVEAGGLMSYGTDTAEWRRQVGAYVGRILKGTKPADLPVVQSTKFDFAINLKTAKSLGLTIPPSVLAIADEVIE
jgi:putative ABC transport system substrate-binding protein